MEDFCLNLGFNKKMVFEKDFEYKIMTKHYQNLVKEALKNAFDERA